jgi:hypothetical protein
VKKQRKQKEKMKRKKRDKAKEKNQADQGQCSGPVCLAARFGLWSRARRVPRDTPPLLPTSRCATIAFLALSLFFSNCDQQCRDVLAPPFNFALLFELC